jgi:hypothetical protein
MHQETAIDGATDSQNKPGVLRVVFIFMLFMSHLVASNCCALATYTRNISFCPDHCQTVGESEGGDGRKDKDSADRCVSCPSQEMKKAAMPDDTSPQPVLPPAMDMQACLCFVLIWNKIEPIPLPEPEERVESCSRRWHFITRASGWSRAPSCPVA